MRYRSKLPQVTDARPLKKLLTHISPKTLSIFLCFSDHLAIFAMSVRVVASEAFLANVVQDRLILVGTVRKSKREKVVALGKDCLQNL